MAGFLVEFCAQAGQALGVFGYFVGFSRGTLADSFFMVEAATYCCERFLCAWK